VAAEDVTRVLDEAGARYELLAHEHTEAALAEAEALGLDPAEVGKTLVVTTPEGYLRAVVPAACRLDLHKLRELVGGGKKQVHLATEEALRRDYPGFELGAVPPFGGSRSDRVVVDRRIAARGSVVVEAGSHDESLRLAPEDLIRLTNADVADVCED
jgi:Cys-tRNA(Pro) deacylase